MKKRLLFILIFLIVISGVSAMTIIEGKVIDVETNLGIYGVVVVIDGVPIATDADGRFTILPSPSCGKLNIQFFKSGYASRLGNYYDISCDNNNDIGDVSLIPEALY